MPDLSTRVWLIRIDCDAPGHVKIAPDHCDVEEDWETRVAALRALRCIGWTFRRNGEAICPKCAGERKSA